MNSAQTQFLSLTKPPARLNLEQAAWYLGFQMHDIPILVSGGLLKPLGNPPANGLKHFATSVLDELRQDAKWLARASDAIHRHWKLKNCRKDKGRSRTPPSPVPVSPVANRD